MSGERTPLRTITIEIFGPNDFAVTEGERSADRLMWDEMLGHIAQLTHHDLGTPRFRALTKDERAAEDARRDAPPSADPRDYPPNEPCIICGGKDHEASHCTEEMPF